MTLIKCFTISHIDNIAACLRLRPERMILVGNRDIMAEPAARYQKILAQKQQHTDITFCDVKGKDFHDLYRVWETLVQKESDAVIDLTGGDETVILAVGAVLGRMESGARQKIRVEKFDRSRSTVVDCIHDGRELSYGRVSLTVAQLLELHGGTLYPDSYQPPVDCRQVDLEGLWKIAAENPTAWNRTIGNLNELESRSESKWDVYLPLENLRNIPDFERKETAVRELLDKFHSCGVVEDRSSRYALEYTYCSELLRYCTLKAGNILEVKTLLEGRGVSHKGAPLFDDCRMSVNIDWDGQVHDPIKRIPETRNEIDVVLIHGLTPLFISCKNGNIGEEELYKLNTVAERFGGPYARKMLIATDLDRKSPSANRAFTQRARDMDIILVTDAGELTPKEWRETLLKAVQ